jgi:hypothetical protein
MFRTMRRNGRKGNFRAAKAIHFQGRGFRPALEALETRVLLSFAAPVSYNIGTQPTPTNNSTGADGVTTGDFTGNGRADLAVVHTRENTLNILLNNGDGTFQPAVSYSCPNMELGATWVTAVDLTGNGILDLAVLGNHNNSALDGVIDIFMGNGDGTFQPAVSYASGPGSRGGIAVGDFNGDGHPDLAVADFNYAGPFSYVGMLINQGDGTFNPVQLVPVNYPAARSVTVGDFDHDGHADLAVADGVGGNGMLDPTYPAGMTILLGNGDGTFRHAGQYNSPATPGGGTVNPEFITIGDLRHNGMTDIVECNYDHNLNVFLGNSDGTFQQAVGYDTGQSPGGYEGGDVNGTYPRAVALADLTGNGKLDLVVDNIGNSNTTPVQLGSVAILLGNGDGTFQHPIQYTPFNYPGWLAVADFNGDGLPDIAVTRLQDGHSVNILLNQREDTTGNIRSYDGSGNNVANPTWGQAGTDLRRIAPAAYGDGVSSLAGTGLPGPRVISNALNPQPKDIPNTLHLSDFIYVWGQFIDHDLDLTPSGTTEPINIPVPTGDPWFDPHGTGSQVIFDSRSLFDLATGTGSDNPREQPNTITAFLDGSVIYGSDPARAAALRTFLGGHLKTSAGNLLPFDSFALPEANDTGQFPLSQLFLTGDVRGNENVLLVTIETLFVREHNRVADLYAAAYPTWTDEQLYQAARRVVGAEIESITYNEFLPALLGPGALPAYAGYDATVNAGIANEFSTAAFRIGHAQLNGVIRFLDNAGNPIRAPLDLAQAFDNPVPVEQAGIDPLLKYLASDNAQEVNTQVIDEIRNMLFGPPGSGGQDLLSLDIQRGRDHGLPDYNTVRQAYSLPAVTSFDQISSDPAVQAELQSLYSDVNHIDLLIGGLAEDHVPGAAVGPTFRAILVNQFTRTRAGDRLWFENTFGGMALTTLQHITLADIIRSNTLLTNIQDNVFFYPGSRVVGRYGFDHPLAGLTYTGTAGVADHVGYLQGTGSFSYTGSFAGTYILSFSAAQSASNPPGSSQTFQVVVDGTVRGTFTPGGIDYATYSTDSFTLTGAHTITFVGLDADGLDTALFDQLTLSVMV